MHGTVIKATGSWYNVENSGNKIISCTIRGSFRLIESDVTNPVVVGDKVDFDLSDDGTGVITEIRKRKNYIIRKSKKLSSQSQIIAANIDRAFLIVTVSQPRTSTGFIDRFLVTAEGYSIPVSLLFNKSDLYTEEEIQYQQALAAIYEPVGYPCILISALSDSDIKRVENSLAEGVNLFSGHSGVGKSTLLNALNPLLGIKTTAISKQHEVGKHTTTFAEMHKLKNGNYIIDTPGIREFGMYDFSKEDLSHYFPEMRAKFNKCKFDNCKHINEPKCAVHEAVEQGIIAESRYQSYLSIFSGEDVFK